MVGTTIIATVGRASLARAVESVLAQGEPSREWEVIVVNDSGQPLPSEAWQSDARVRVVRTEQRERCVARNTGAALARGQYLHFLDDDDWLLPGAVAAWGALHQSQGGRAGWLYGASQLVDRRGNTIIQVRPEWQGNLFAQAMAGEWIALQASLVAAADFFAVGGFNPLVVGAEDVDLCRRVTLRAEAAGTTALVAAIGMGEAGSTTNRERAAREARLARESILDDRRCFARMRASASTSFWQGRVVRAYLTSAVLNMQQRRLWAAGSRMAWVGVGLLMAARHWLSGDFWGAIRRPLASQTFARGAAEAAGAQAGATRRAI
jgi:glycosyltransferase involved in cell wall biosynthesis